MSESAEHAFAVVEEVAAEGLRLKFDGEDEAGEKLYKCNTFFKFSVGDRVYCVKDSGTFVAICKIGAPAQTITADKATEAETADKATTAKTAETVSDVEEAEWAESVEDYSNSFYRIFFRQAYSTGIVDYGRTYQGGSVQYWFPLGCPIDGAASYTTEDAIVKFRSTTDGGLEFCVPYRDSYTWKKIATE